MARAAIAETWTARKADDEARHLTSCLACREKLRPREDQKLYLVKNARTREARHVLVNGKDLAATVGWPEHEVLYSLMIEDGAKKGSPMTEDAKARLRAAAAERKLKKALRANTTTRPAEVEQGETEMNKKKSSKSKTPKIEKNRRAISVFDLSATAVVRWMGKNGFDFAEAKSALNGVGATNALSDGTIRAQIYHGKKGSRGEPAKLTVEQQKILRDAAKIEKKEAVVAA